MGVTWKQDILVLVALFDKDVKEALYGTYYAAQTVTGKQFEVNQHLVVT